MIEAANVWMREVMSKFDPSHDALHVERVTRTALSLARSFTHTTTPPDLFVVELAAILHDLFDKKYHSSTADDSLNSPIGPFLPFFERTHQHIDLISDGRAELIAKIVENVSWTTEKRLRSEGKWGEWHQACIELHCVQDADRLDAIGAFGIMRCAAYSATTNRALYAPPDSPASSTSAIQHFHDKLLHIRERLKTDMGKRLGEKRHQFMLDFLKSVDEEYENKLD